MEREKLKKSLTTFDNLKFFWEGMFLDIEGAGVLKEIKEFSQLSRSFMLWKCVLNQRTNIMLYIIAAWTENFNLASFQRKRRNTIKKLYQNDQSW